MRLAKTDVIAGLDATTARELMRSLRTEKSLEYVRTRLPAGTDAAAALTELVEAGFLTEEHGSPVDGDRWWVTTTRGNALGMASFAKPISRATAERLLAGLLDRARTWNENPERLVSIEEIVVFGSYLDPTVDQLGDVDIAVTIRNWPDGDVPQLVSTQRVLAHCLASGRTFPSFIDRLMWPTREAVLHLKNRSAALNITTENIRNLTDDIRVAYRRPGSKEPPPGSPAVTP